MNINGTYIMREIVGEYVLVPVEDTALAFSGIISLNEVGAAIWKGLEAGLDREGLLQKLLEEFDVSEQEARTDLEEFLQMLLQNKLITE